MAATTSYNLPRLVHGAHRLHEMWPGERRLAGCHDMQQRPVAHATYNNGRRREEGRILGRGARRGGGRRWGGALTEVMAGGEAMARLHGIKDEGQWWGVAVRAGSWCEMPCKWREN
jgi:hypothetical protein